MNHSLQQKCVVAGSIIFLLWVYRLPAPIVEPESTPVPVEAKKSVTPAPASAAAPRSTGSDLDRFKGTWAYQESYPEDLTKSPPTAPGTFHNIITVKDGSAVLEIRHTDIMRADHWNSIPPPYDTARELYVKVVTVSEKIEVTGSTLSIRCGPWKIVDWTPKVPKSVLLNSAWMRELLPNLDHARRGS
jgi:hypothetical protein